VPWKVRPWRPLALCVPAPACPFIIEAAGTGLFPHGMPLENILLVGGGVVTVVPLPLLSETATRIPLATIGVIQYINPRAPVRYRTAVPGETMAAGRRVGFALAWMALSVPVSDRVRERRADLGPASPSHPHPRSGRDISPLYMGYSPVRRPPVILLLGCLIPY
jgi:hypothetical protein